MSLIDPATGLSHHVLKVEELCERLRKDRIMGLIMLNISGLDAIEESRGPQHYDDIMLKISECLQTLKGKIIRDADIITAAEIGLPSFLIFLSGQRSDRHSSGTLTKENVQEIAKRIEDSIYPEVCKASAKYLKELPRISMGYSLIVYNPLIRSRRLIYKLIEETKVMSRLQLPLSKIRNKDRLQEIIIKEDITTLFHPIIDLSNGETMGYEGLTRGPKGTAFESPMTLFSIAKDVGLIFELDRICRRTALTNSKLLPQHAKVFVNSLPTTIHDPEFRGEFLSSFLDDINLKAENIVFEINERVAIDNFASFREATKYYTDKGMSIAIDDTGTGYSTLEAIVELSPQYLKFDISMVNGIHKNTMKQEMLKMLSGFANKIDATIIAEGIEEKEDLEMLQQMGIRYGQGYYFCKPLTVEEINNRTQPFSI